MHAQIIEISLEPAPLEAVERLIRQELVPALREQPGFCGALNLTERARSEALLVLLWETEEDAARPLASWIARVKSPSAAMTELLALRPSSVTTWEVDARG